MSSKRNHHKQPNFYLKGFKSSDEGKEKVWVYEKGKPFYDGKTEQLQNPKHLTTEKAARTRDFYAFEKDDGTKDYDKYEDLLEQQFECPATDVISKIRRFEEIDETDKEILSNYIASMITRGEWWREGNKELQKNYVEYMNPEWIKKDFEERLGVPLSKALAQEVQEKFKLAIGFGSQERLLEKMIEKIDLLSEHIKKMNWRILVSPDYCKFLTSDNPVWYRKLLDSDFGELFFAISSKAAISISWRMNTDHKWNRKSKTIWEVDSKATERARNCIVQFALKEVYYSQKAEWLVKFINNRIDK
jgi:hypothetical protein